MCPLDGSCAQNRNAPLSEAVDEWAANAPQSPKEPSNRFTRLLGWVRRYELVWGCLALLAFCYGVFTYLHGKW